MSDRETPFDEPRRARVEWLEDLIAWQKARELVCRIYEVTRKEPFSRDFELRGEIREAAVSSMSNIAEGFERSRPAEFHQFLSISKASCGEVRSQLYVASDVGYLTKEEFRDLLNLALEVSRVVGGLRASVERRRDRTKQKRKPTLTT